MRHSLAFVVLSALTACSTTAPKAANSTVPACPANATVMDGWDDRAPPRKIFGNTFYVGTCGITALLVTSPQGHVLLDGATEPAGPLIAENIKALGFQLNDVKFILNSHEHHDHAAGIAHLQRVTGATVLARAPALATLRRGRSDRDDPQFLELGGFPAINADNSREIGNGDIVRVGELALTAHATPGHTPGGTSWTWTSCEDTRCVGIAYTDSVSAASDKVYRYSAHPEHVAAFRSGLDTIATLPCDVLIAPHPLVSNLFARLDGQAALVDAGACRQYAETGRSNLQKRLQSEETNP